MSNPSLSEFVERSVWCSSPCGLHRMVYTEWGEQDNPDVLLCVHGLSRNGRDFDDLARALASRYRVICPDVVGRGKSDWLRDPLCYTFPQYVADMVTLIARLNVTMVNWLGTSMGGLIGMLLASQENAPIARLILNDVGPVISSVSLRRIGEYLGNAPKFDTLEDAERFIRSVSAPFGKLTDDQWRHLTETSLRKTVDGRLEMRYDPGIVETFRRSTASGEIDLWPIYDRICCRTLVVRGVNSDLLTIDTAREMALRGPHPKTVEVPEVGHAPTFMDQAQIAIVRDFLSARL